MSSTTAFLPTSLEHLYRRWQGCPWDSGKARLCDDDNAGYALESRATLRPFKWLSRGETGNQTRMPSDAEHNHWSPAPPYISSRVVFRRYTMMESQCSILASPYIKVTVTLPSSLHTVMHTVNSQFAIPLQCPSAKATHQCGSPIEEAAPPRIDQGTLYDAMAQAMNVSSSGKSPALRWRLLFQQWLSLLLPSPIPEKVQSVRHVGIKVHTLVFMYSQLALCCTLKGHYEQSDRCSISTSRLRVDSC